VGASIYRPLVLGLLLIAALAGFAATGKPSDDTPERPLGDTASTTTAGGDTTAPTGSGLVTGPPGHGSALVRAEFETTLAKQPKDPSALLLLAAEIAQFDGEEGVRSHERLVAVYPRSAATSAALANSLYEAGKLEDSRTTLRRALRLHPELPEGRLLRGKLLATDGLEGLDRALGEWRQVIEQAPASPAAREAARLIQLHEGR